MQMSASWKTGKGKTRFDRRYPICFWARIPMEAVVSRIVGVFVGCLHEQQVHHSLNPVG
jgi:hypothetical protein